ncbi:unnamed protein product [Paramecium sonneborni]|uniref:Uncharacterized protein n=1 Tax=Paramecium sonneborni TaxID=65129 RepID=A0A8S1RUG7_9CILI|nr:unnamed protein product [Paramecium sonneborni]
MEIQLSHFIYSERSALNMAYQGLTNENDEIIYALPMPGIKINKATGVATSKPSDSPQDWVTLRDLQNKADFIKSSLNGLISKQFQQLMFLNMVIQLL